MGDRNEQSWATVVQPSKRSRTLVADVAQMEHEALIGRWCLRLIPVALGLYLAARLYGWAL